MTGFVLGRRELIRDNYYHPTSAGVLVFEWMQHAPAELRLQGWKEFCETWHYRVAMPDCYSTRDLQSLFENLITVEQNKTSLVRLSQGGYCPDDREECALFYSHRFNPQSPTQSGRQTHNSQKQCHKHKNCVNQHIVFHQSHKSSHRWGLKWIKLLLMFQCRKNRAELKNFGPVWRKKKNIYEKIIESKKLFKKSIS